MSEEERWTRVLTGQARTIALLEKLGEKLDDHIEHEGKWREKVDRVVPELDKRIDRLEQDRDRARWMTRFLLGAVVTLGAVVLRGLL